MHVYCYWAQSLCTPSVDSSTYRNPNIWNLSSATLRLFMSLWKYLITLQQAERWNWLQHRQSASWDAQLDWNCSAGRVTGSLTACRPSSSLSHRLWRSIKPLKGETHNAVWRNSIQARRTQLFFNYVTAACLTAWKLQWHDAAAADCKMQSHVGPWWRQEAAQKGRRKKKKRAMATNQQLSDRTSTAPSSVCTWRLQDSCCHAGSDVTLDLWLHLMMRCI